MVFSGLATAFCNTPDELVAEAAAGLAAWEDAELKRW